MKELENTDFEARGAALVLKATRALPKRLSPEYGGCPCCVSKEESLLLGRGEAPMEVLGRYAFKAMSTWGSSELYRSLFPKIIGASFRREGRSWPGFEASLIGRKLRMADVFEWSDGERDVVDEYFALELERSARHGCVNVSEVPGYLREYGDLVRRPEVLLDGWQRSLDVSIASLVGALFGGAEPLRAHGHFATGHLRIDWLTRPFLKREGRRLLKQTEFSSLVERHCIAEAIEVWERLAG